MPRELIAKNRVFVSVRTAPDDIARIKVAHHEGNFSLFEPLFDLLLQKQTDVTQPDVSRSVTFVSSVPQQFLSRTLGDCNYCVPAADNPAFQRGEKSAFPLQLERHFGDEREVHILACHGSFGSQKSGMASHEFH